MTIQCDKNHNREMHNLGFSNHPQRGDGETGVMLDTFLGRLPRVTEA